MTAKRILVLGGARSGKSHAAEAILADAAQVDYVATGTVPGTDDPEWAARVETHRARRPQHWRTVETRSLVPILEAGPDAPAALVECVSTWLSGVMDDCGLWSGAPDADAALAARVDELVAAWAASERFVVAVSNEVGLGVVPATTSGRRYRDELGRLNARLAATADEVWLVIAGIRQRLK